MSTIRPRPVHRSPRAIQTSAHPPLEGDLPSSLGSPSASAVTQSSYSGDENDEELRRIYDVEDDFHRSRGGGAVLVPPPQTHQSPLQQQQQQQQSSTAGGGQEGATTGNGTGSGTGNDEEKGDEGRQRDDDTAAKMLVLRRSCSAGDADRPRNGGGINRRHENGNKTKLKPTRSFLSEPSTSTVGSNGGVGLTGGGGRRDSAVRDVARERKKDLSRQKKAAIRNKLEAQRGISEFGGGSSHAPPSPPPPPPPPSHQHADDVGDEEERRGSSGGTRERSVGGSTGRNASVSSVDSFGTAPTLPPSPLFSMGRAASSGSTSIRSSGGGRTSSGGPQKPKGYLTAVGHVPDGSLGTSLQRKSSWVVVDAQDAQDAKNSRNSVLSKRRRVNLLVDQCETVRFPFKKKLVLANMNLTSDDVPVDDICSKTLGPTLHKLSLAGNRLITIPPTLVVKLPGLRALDLSQCDLRELPTKWDLPCLKRLNLSHNRLEEFPDEAVLEGLPELQHLDLYGNKVYEIIVPEKLLSKLEFLNLGYNNLSHIPDDVDQLTSLRTLKVSNNVLEKVPMCVCDMDLKVLDVSSNPLVQPPVETCERGIHSMRRYYHCLKLEETAQKKMMEDLQKKNDAKRPSKERHEKSRAKMRKKKESLRSFGSPFQRLIKCYDECSALSAQSAQRLPQPPPATPPRQMLPYNDGRKVSQEFASAALAPPGGFSELEQEAPLGRSHTRPRQPLEEAAVEVPVDDLKEKLVLQSSDRTSATSASTLYDDGFDGAVSRLRDAQADAQEARRVEFSTPILEKGEGVTKQVSESTYSDITESMSSVGSQDMPLESDAAVNFDARAEGTNEITVNDTLKVIFVGMACSGKTSIIKRLIEGRDAVVPKQDERTVGVDIYEWDPKVSADGDSVPDTSILVDDEIRSRIKGDVDVKFSVWDFAGQHVYHATHELFFSSQALYVLVWDMGASNNETRQRRESIYADRGAFKLSYDSSDEEEDDIISEEETRRVNRALEREIDDKVQFWVDCIQSSAPGAAIFPVTSFDDYFEDGAEAARRCSMMKERLQKHEEKSLKGLQKRLLEFHKGHRANAEGALRLRNLICNRPRLIFCDDDDESVVRVSCTKYTGFDRLSKKIVDIAVGRELGGLQYPVFRGHVGARIPRMRLDVRDVVRSMRDRFKVVEWGYFLGALNAKGIERVDDVSDALHFLANIGELSYFGDVVKDGSGGSMTSSIDDEDHEGSDMDIFEGKRPDQKSAEPHENDDDDDDEEALITIDKFCDKCSGETGKSRIRVARNISSDSASSIDSTTSLGLSQYVFLNPRWLVAAVACILRHDLTREIYETRRALKRASMTWDKKLMHSDSFHETSLNYPVITADDACMLWQAKKFTKKAAERAKEHSNNPKMNPFEFLQRLLVRFGVFVPIDLSIDKAFLGGTEYGRGGAEHSETFHDSSSTELAVSPNDAETPKFFFLPSLLGPGEPSEVWTYKNSESWKTTLCHSNLFPDGVPPGLMERITASVLSDVYAATQTSIPPLYSQKLSVPRLQSAQRDRHNTPREVEHHEGQLHVKEILCWRSAFFLKIGMENVDPEDNETRKESIVEIFAVLVDQGSHFCVASDSMGVGMRRLILSAKGQAGDGGRKIWNGGYVLVLRAIVRVMNEYGGLEFEKQGICPECLAKKPIAKASVWDWSTIQSAALRGEDTMRCRYGHRVDMRFICGRCANLAKANAATENSRLLDGEAVVPVTDLLRGVVIVGLFDEKAKRIVKVGSGFVVDRKRGLIVTAGHTIMSKDSWRELNGRIVIGVIPREGDENRGDGTTAVFRYFAKIAAKDPNIDENGICRMDACVLRITTRMEKDIGGNGDEVGEQPEILLVNDPDSMRKQKLHSLKVSEECELDEQVRILGFNQGGEGLIGPGEDLNRCADFARGYVCMKFASNEVDEPSLSRRFQPRSEIVAICPTIGGHSGGPCVNQQGEVIGILSRADPAEKQRCYLAPASEWKPLVSAAKRSPF